MDIHEIWGLDVMAQVDLDRRVHKNQDTKALGRMAFVIIMTFLNRMASQQRIAIRQDLFDEMIQYTIVQNQIKSDIRALEQHERPPMKEIPEYREKFGLKRKAGRGSKLNENKKRLSVEKGNVST